VNHRILVRTTDILEVESSLDALHAAGIEALERAENSVGGILGSTGQEFLIEVDIRDLPRAAQVLEQGRKELAEQNTEAMAAAPAEPEAQEEQAPRAYPAALAAWRLASKAALLLSSLLLVLRYVAGFRSPLQFFGAVVFDFLIWRAFTGAELSEAGARRLRSFGLMRGLIGSLVTIAFAIGGPPSNWLAVGAQLVIVALYSRSPKPDAQTAS
jgi:hypothetical protein